MATDMTAGAALSQRPVRRLAAGSPGSLPPVKRRARRRHRDRLTIWTTRVLLVVATLALMTLLNHTQGDLVMPRPDKVVQAGWRMFANGTMWTALRQSLRVFSIGFSTAIASGVVGGIVVGGFPRVGRVFDPFINALNSTPRVAFIPLIIVWFGLDTTAKIVVTWLSAVIPILINTASGMEAADADLSEMARSLGATRRQLFWRVLIPGAFPVILTGLRIGSALAILGTVVSELYTAEAGLGGLLVESSNHFEMAKYFAVVFVLMVIGVAVTSLLRALERHFLTWRPTGPEGEN